MPNDPGVPLSHYQQHHQGAAVRFICTACQASHDVPVQRVIERLKARGLGGETTGIRAVAGLAQQPCRQCGQKRWETRPALRL